MGKNEKKKKKGRFTLLDKIIMAVAVAVLVVSGYKLAGIFLEYKEGEDAYDSLTDQYVTYLDDASLPDAQEEEEEEDPSGTIPKLSIDYDGLKSINDQFVAWLSVPALEISYPVVQGEDNDYYLHRTFDGKSNSSGAIFMDFAASPDLSDYNTVIYGHNMKNGSMFGKLKRFVQEDGLCAQNPYFYLYTKDTVYQYLIVSYYVTHDGSSTYVLPLDETAYGEYKALIMKNSAYQGEIEIPKEGRMVTLSTCYGAAGGTQRFVVHGICVQETPNE